MKTADKHHWTTQGVKANSGEIVFHAVSGRTIERNSYSGSVKVKRLLSGAASICNLFPVRDENWRKLSAPLQHETDRDAFIGDWAAIGGDFNRAIAKVTGKAP